ncbi:MAG: hypothetical protein U9M90_04560 [Patescibacteria group bacterium]|nr:hypothetical protein [Patescibacteria group bacterium]
MEDRSKSLKNKNLRRASESAEAIANSTATLMASLLKGTNLLHDNVSWLRGHIELLSHRDIETITNEMTTDIVASLTTIVEDAPKLLNSSILLHAIREAANAKEYLKSLEE